MVQHRYRQNKIKREHTILDGLWPVLEQMAAHPDVQSITPGRISPRTSNRAEGLRFQYHTETGLKLLARASRAVQEVFVVTHKPDAVLAAWRKQGLLAEEAREAQSRSKTRTETQTGQSASSHQREHFPKSVSKPSQAPSSTDKPGHSHAAQPSQGTQPSQSPQPSRGPRSSHALQPTPGPGPSQAPQSSQGPRPDRSKTDRPNTDRPMPKRSRAKRPKRPKPGALWQQLTKEHQRLLDQERELLAHLADGD